MRTRLGLVATTLVLVPAGTSRCAPASRRPRRPFTTRRRAGTPSSCAPRTPCPGRRGCALRGARAGEGRTREADGVRRWQLTFGGCAATRSRPHPFGQTRRKGPIVLPLCVLCGSGMRGRAQFPAGLPGFTPCGAGSTATSATAEANVDVHTSGRPSGAIRGPLTSPNWTAWLWWSEGEPQPPSAGGYSPLVTAARS